MHPYINCFKARIVWVFRLYENSMCFFHRTGKRPAHSLIKAALSQDLQEGFVRLCEV